MERRLFLGLCAVSGTSLLVSAEQRKETRLSDETYGLIAAVQLHMFPVKSTIPSAASFSATSFLEKTIMHPTFDRDIRNYVIEGAQKLHKRTNQKFLDMHLLQKEQALREYEETGYGGGWLEQIMLLSLEGLLSDPIYGGNKEESGWKVLGTVGGDPRPTQRYAGL